MDQKDLIERLLVIEAKLDDAIRRSTRPGQVAYDLQDGLVRLIQDIDPDVIPESQVGGSR